MADTYGSGAVELGPLYIYGSATPAAATDGGTSTRYETVIHGSEPGTPITTDAGTPAGSAAGSAGGTPVISYAEWDRPPARPAGSDPGQRPASSSPASGPVTSQAKKSGKQPRRAGEMTVGELRKAGLLDALLSIHRAPSEDYSLFGEHHARTEDRLTAEEITGTQQGNAVLSSFMRRHPFLWSVDTGKPDPDLYRAKVRFSQQAIEGWNLMASSRITAAGIHGALSMNLTGLALSRSLATANVSRLTAAAARLSAEGRGPAPEGEGTGSAAEGEGMGPAAEGEGNPGGSEEPPLDPDTPVKALAPPVAAPNAPAAPPMVGRYPRLLVKLDDGQVILVRQSANAGRLPEGTVSASAQTPRSNLYTSIGADVGENHAYKTTLLDGDIGLAEPNGANRPGLDAVTAGDKSGRMRVHVDQYKTSTRESFEKGKWKPEWLAEVKRAIEDMELAPEDAKLGEEVVKAYERGDVYLRQFNISRSPAGQMRVTLASEVRVPVNSPLNASKLLMKPTAPVVTPPR